jgi:hypothetical protein
MAKRDPQVGARGRARLSISLGASDPRGRRSAQTSSAGLDVHPSLLVDARGRLRVDYQAPLSEDGELLVGGVGLSVAGGRLVQDLGAIAEALPGNGLEAVGGQLQLRLGTPVDDATQNTQGSPTTGGLQTTINALAVTVNELLDALRKAQHIGGGP